MNMKCHKHDRQPSRSTKKEEMRNNDKTNAAMKTSAHKEELHWRNSPGTVSEKAKSTEACLWGVGDGVRVRVGGGAEIRSGSEKARLYLLMKKKSSFLRFSDKTTKCMFL